VGARHSEYIDFVDKYRINYELIDLLVLAI
jgi:hypothetical protein